MSLADWKNVFQILGMLGLFASTLVYITGQPGSTNEKLCDWLQQQNPVGYNQLLSTDAQFRATCCAYDPANKACRQ
ncbi:MAG: hypothetical protein L0Z73_14180 [Gammaproteobacteria bacterium]|nr:hypothetical protein [Gammaproteobacteria bacterium]